MLASSKFVAHAALLLTNAVPADWPEQHHLPEEPGGGRVPEPRGAVMYGTDSRARYNGTGTAVWGTNTAYYWPGVGP
jgi:hypothetical protein